MNLGILPPKSNFPISLPIFSFRKPACRFRSDRNRSSWARSKAAPFIFCLMKLMRRGRARISGKVLTPDRLAGLPPKALRASALSAEGGTVSADRLKAARVVVKQIPYQVEGV